MVNILEILGKVGFDWQVALANFFNFLIILFLLKKFAFKPIQKVIKERQDKIHEGLENAKKAETDLMMAGAKGEEIINEAKNESLKVMEKSLETTKEILEKAKTKAKEAADDIVLAAVKTKNAQIEKMQKDFQEKSISLIIASAEKLMKENMDDEQNKKYLKKILLDG